MKNGSLRTNISDFNIEELSTIIRRWFQLLENDIDSIATFFETQYNEHMTPSAMLKNYVSVIDGLSRELKVSATGQSYNNQKYKRFEDIFKNIKHHLTAKEYNEIKMAVLRESPSELKPRFIQLLNNLLEYANIELNPDFCYRAVETRNFLTHPKASGKDVFHKEQYRDVAFCLEDLIRAYILNRIGVSKEIAKKILPSKITISN